MTRMLRLGCGDSELIDGIRTRIVRMGWDDSDRAVWMGQLALSHGRDTATVTHPSHGKARMTSWGCCGSRRL